GRRLTAVTALGRMVHTEAQAQTTLHLLQDLLIQTGPDPDLLRASLCLATVALANAHEPLITGELIAFLDKVVEAPGEATQYRAAHALWVNEAAHKHSELTRVLLKPLAQLKPAHKGTLRELDLALSHVFKKGDPAIAIDFVTEFLSGP